MSLIKIVCPHCDNRFFRENEVLQAGVQFVCPRCFVTLEVGSTKPLRLHAVAPDDGALEDDAWDEFDDFDDGVPRAERQPRDRERSEEDPPPRKRPKHLHHRSTRRRPAEEDA